MENDVFKEDVDIEQKQVDTNISKCPECGANMVFSPADNALKCPYCDSVVGVERKSSAEVDLSKLFSGTANDWATDTNVYSCSNCGAKEIISKSEIVQNCPFCGTSNVVKTDDLSGLKPNAIIPFAIDKATASARVIAWAKKKFFAPRRFKENVKPEKLAGKYMPAFTFDAMTNSSYHGRLGVYYYETVRRGKNTVTVRKTRWFNIQGRSNMNFDDVLVKASDALPQKDLNNIMPYATNQSNEYNQTFLHGFSASQYSMTGEQCWNVAKQHMREKVRKRILSGYKYDVVGNLNIDTDFHNITYKYILLPLYVGHCNYSKKLYNFFVNGQNGKVSGKTPVSPVKVGILAGIGALLLAGIGLIVYFCG